LHFSLHFSIADIANKNNLELDIFRPIVKSLDISAVESHQSGD
jgi:hypothetical protein